MIGYIEGEIIALLEKTVTIKTGGVGYRIFATYDLLQSLQKEKGAVGLWTHLAVRENAQDLFGFLSKEDRDFFELLITIPGIGPKSALVVLNAVPVKTLITAISKEDVSYLTRVSGIGKKTADKIILELKGKIVSEEGGVAFSADTDVLDALKSLGYGEREIRDTLKKIPESVSDTRERVKEALKLLGKK
jgi:Holliday junction DNA helicase RuvA